MNFIFIYLYLYIVDVDVDVVVEMEMEVEVLEVMKGTVNGLFWARELCREKYARISARMLSSRCRAALPDYQEKFIIYL